MDIVSPQPMIARDRICADFLEGVTLMRISGRIIDGGGEKVFGQLLAARLIGTFATSPATTTSTSAATFARAPALAPVCPGRSFARCRTRSRYLASRLWPLAQC